MKTNNQKDLKTISKPVNDSFTTGMSIDSGAADIQEQDFETMYAVLATIIEYAPKYSSHLQQARGGKQNEDAQIPLKFKVSFDKFIPGLKHKGHYEFLLADDYGFLNKTQEARSKEDLKVKFKVRLLNPDGGLSLYFDLLINLMRNNRSNNPNPQISIVVNPTTAIQGHNIEHVSYEAIEDDFERDLAPFLVSFYLVRGLIRSEDPDFEYSEEFKKTLSEGLFTVTSLQFATYMQIATDMREPFLELIAHIYNLASYDGKKYCRFRDFIGIDRKHPITDRLPIVLEDGKEKLLVTSSAMLVAKRPFDKIPRYTVDFYDKFLWLLRKRDLYPHLVSNEMLEHYGYLQGRLRIDCQLHLDAVLTLLKDTGVIKNKKDKNSPYVKDIIEALSRVNGGKVDSYPNLSDWLIYRCNEYYTSFDTLMRYCALGLDPDNSNLIQKIYRELRSEFVKGGKASKKQVTGLDALYNHQPTAETKFSPRKIINKAILREHKNKYSQTQKLIKKIKNAGLPTSAPIVIYERLLREVPRFGLNLRQLNELDRLKEKESQATQKLNSIVRGAKRSEPDMEKYSEIICEMQHRQKEIRMLGKERMKGFKKLFLQTDRRENLVEPKSNKIKLAKPKKKDK